MALSISDQVRTLMRPEAAALEPYDPGFSPVAINLSANENTYGMPAQVRAAVNEVLAATPLNRYPSPLSDDLREAIGTWHGIGPERVVVGNGGDELIFNLFLAFGGPGHVLLNSTPTFSVYRLYAELVGTPVVDVPRDAETLVPDIDALVERAPEANLIVLTSPNNPTGDVVSRANVARLCEACPGIVLMDEAYMEFAPSGTSCEPLLGTYPNLAILHTLSKAFAFAGGRVGYVLADPSVIGALSAVRQPYTVDVMAQAAALAIVRRRASFEPTIATIRAERVRLSEALDALPGVRVWPSSANFICVRLPHAHEARERLRDEYSILVRDFSSTPGLEGCLRVTVGMPQENDRVIAAISQIVS